MKSILSVRYSAFLTVLLLAFGLQNQVQAQSNSAIAVLENAYNTLAQADHDYKGHRAKAMNEIKIAAHELGGKIKGDGKGHEPQATSDAQLRAAMGMLQQALPGLSGKPLHHVNEAIKQINVALAIK